MEQDKFKQWEKQNAKEHWEINQKIENVKNTLNLKITQILNSIKALNMKIAVVVTINNWQRWLIGLFATIIVGLLGYIAVVMNSQKNISQESVVLQKAELDVRYETKKQYENVMQMLKVMHQDVETNKVKLDTLQRLYEINGANVRKELKELRADVRGLDSRLDTLEARVKFHDKLILRRKGS